MSEPPREDEPPRNSPDLLEAALRRAAAEGGPDRLLEAGRQLQRSGDASGAHDFYERAAAAGSIEALDELGLLHMERGEFSVAESDFRRAVAAGSVDALHHLGLLLMRTGRMQEAEKVLRDASARGNVDALNNLGIVFQTRGAMDEAQEAFARFEALRNTDADASPAPAPPPFSLAARAIADLPSEEDLLGFSPLVEGLRALLNVRRTQLPLAIAITAPWGAGKSSVMLQLRQLLREPGDRQPCERTWWTVDFPAWKYERSERLWAALAKAIYEQPQEQMTLLQRVRFRVRVERERLGWRRFLAEGAWPPIAAGGAVLVAFGSGKHLAGAPTPALITSGAAFVAGISRFWGLASMPFKRAVERHASAPDYEGQLGFTAEADRDIRSLTRVLAPDSEKDPRALAVFVDDLDRCTSAHVVEVVEAMNQVFNADGRHGCVFVLGVDREVVATSIEVAYAPTVRALRRARRPVSDGFGMQFLAKLVQLSVAVPEPSGEGIERLLTKLTGNARAARSEDQEAIERVEEDIRRQAPERLADVAEAATHAGAAPAAAELEAQRRVRAEMIRDSPDVAEAEFELLRHLDRNPRQVKRFDNAFRLQLYVANEDPDCRLSFSVDELIALGKWVALRLRWPELAEAIDDEPDLLGALEATANGSHASVMPGELTRLQRVYARWFVDREVLSLLRDAGDRGAARRVTSLEPGAFLRVT